MNTQPRRLVLMLVAVFATVCGQAQAAFTSMVVIGDSLSDQGNVYLITSGAVPPPEYTDGANIGRFTNGLNYIDYLSSSLGISVAPSLGGGSNYATGGARTDSASIGGIPLPPGFSLLEQRDNYLTSVGPGGIDPNALHVVWGGSNDMTDILEGLFDGTIIDPFPAMENTLFNLFDIVSSLAAADAKNIVVPNIPNLGLVPLLTGGGPPVDQATQLTALFNDGLDAALDAVAASNPDTTLFRVDTFGLLTDAFLDPASFGFTNVTEGCYTEFVVPGGITCPNPDEYLSWDGFHPTTRTHQLLADNVVIPVPAAVWLFCSGLFGLIFAARRKQNA